MTMDDMLAIVKPHNDKIVAEYRLAEAERKIESAMASLKLIAEFAGKTLIAPSLGPDCDEAHQLGAAKAFEQAADIAREAIASLSPRNGACG